MSEMRKVTVRLPSKLVEASLRASGKGLTETIREALVAQNHAWACRRLLEMRGKLDLRVDWQALREEK